MVAKQTFVGVDPRPGPIALGRPRLAPRSELFRRPALDRVACLLVAGTAILAVGWALLVVFVEPLRLVTLAPRPQVAVDATSSLCRLFAALVLVLFPHGAASRRLSWVGAGLAVTGIGGLAFGNLWPMWSQTTDADGSMYASFVVWTTAAALAAIGLLPSRPPRLSAPVAVGICAGFAALAAVVVAAYDRLPTLAGPPLQATASLTPAYPMPGLTAWHWGLTLVPLGLAVAAAGGALVRGQGEGWQRWLPAALVLFAGSILHHALWPSAFSTVLTSTDLLRLGSGAVLAVGGIFELRRLADERAQMLATEREHAEVLARLATMRSDFTAMVAHEIDPTIAAIRAWTEVLASGKARPEQQDRAVATIRTQTLRLQALAADVKAIATVERDDFTVLPAPIAVDEIVAAATAPYQGLPGHPPLRIAVHARDLVRADPDRIGQVLRNLLDNALRFSPEGAPVEVVATRLGGSVRIAVIDRGPGVAAGDECRIFEKYVQGRNKGMGSASGVGLGLYLSSRIVRAHGGSIGVGRTPGGGATFWFDLPAVA